LVLPAWPACLLLRAGAGRSGFAGALRAFGCLLLPQTACCGCSSAPMPLLVWRRQTLLRRSLSTNGWLAVWWSPLPVLVFISVNKRSNHLLPVLLMHRPCRAAQPAHQRSRNDRSVHLP